MANWGYTKLDGPETWVNNFPIAKGKRQSPIDIVPTKAKSNPDLVKKPFQIKYIKEHTKSVKNTGVGCHITIDGSGSSLEGGPLKNQHKIEQFHLHWGASDATGSEHTLNGQKFSAELHLVHWDCVKCSSFADAVANDGLCVLGVFFKIGKENAALKKLTDLLPKIEHKGQEIAFPEGFDPASLLPKDLNKYWTYAGSLTTPPLAECVTWVVFQEPLEISEEQIQAFRDLLQNPDGSAPLENEFHGHVVENYRPPQPVGERQVESSF